MLIKELQLCKKYVLRQYEEGRIRLLPKSINSLDQLSWWFLGQNVKIYQKILIYSEYFSLKEYIQFSHILQINPAIMAKKVYDLLIWHPYFFMSLVRKYTRSSDSALSISAILRLVFIEKLPKSSFSAFLELNKNIFSSD